MRACGSSGEGRETAARLCACSSASPGLLPPNSTMRKPRPDGRRLRSATNFCLLRIASSRSPFDPFKSYGTMAPGISGT